MLHALVPGGEEVAIHAGRATALLDQLELNIPRVGQGDGDVHVIVAPAGVGEAGDRQAVGVEPRSHAADLHPVAHRGFDVAHDDAHLTHVSKQTAHLQSSPSCAPPAGAILRYIHHALFIKRAKTSRGCCR